MFLEEDSQWIKREESTEIFVRFILDGKKERSHSRKFPDLFLSAKKIIFLQHGFGEHSRRYFPLLESLKCIDSVECQDVAYVLMDLRGHGGSGPSLGDAQSFQDMVDDLLSVIQLVQKSCPNIKSYGFFGHSFGGLLMAHISAQIGKQSPPLFLSSPCFAVKQEIPLWKKYAVKLLDNFLPRLKLPVGIDLSFLSTNEKNNRSYEHDPLCLHRGTARLGRILLEETQEKNLAPVLRKILAPVTVIASMDDKLVDTQVTKNYSAQFGTCSSTWFEKAGHEVFNEVEPYRTQAIHLLKNWIQNLP